MQLIDPKMSIDTIRSYIEVWDCKGCLPYGGVQHNVMSVDDLLCLPTIEAEPVKHGRWKCWTTSKFTGKYKDYDEPEFKDYVYYTCSECYRKSAIKELYCPNCGARMDGGTL